MKYITVSPALEKAVREKIEATLDICRKKYNVALPAPVLKFRQCGRVAGYYQPPQAFYGKPELLVINPDFFKNHYDDQMNVTVPHEVAHYVTHHIFSNRVQTHGREWASVMRAIGLPPDRCHTFSLEGVKTRQVSKPYKYTCNCSVGVRWFTELKHKKHQSWMTAVGKGYRCKRCNANLTYLGRQSGGQFIESVKNPKPVVEFVQVFNVEKPVPLTIKEPEQQFKTVTKFVNGMLTNVKVPVEA